LYAIVSLLFFCVVALLRFYKGLSFSSFLLLLLLLFKKAKNKDMIIPLINKKKNSSKKQLHSYNGNKIFVLFFSFKPFV
jgi:hypothetical protein